MSCHTLHQDPLSLFACARVCVCVCADADVSVFWILSFLSDTIEHLPRKTSEGGGV